MASRPRLGASARCKRTDRACQRACSFSDRSACGASLPARSPAALLPHAIADGDECGQNHGAQNIRTHDEGIPGAEAVGRAPARCQKAVGEDDEEGHRGGQADGDGDFDKLAHDWRHGTPPQCCYAPEWLAPPTPLFSTAASSSRVQPEALCGRKLADSCARGWKYTSGAPSPRSETGLVRAEAADAVLRDQGRSRLCATNSPWLRHCLCVVRRLLRLSGAAT